MDREEILREQAEEHLLQEGDRRRFLYEDVEALIFSGMLQQRVEVGDHSFVLRTLTDPSKHLLTTRCDSDPVNWKRHQVAHSIYMVNGFYVHQDDPNAAYHIYHEWLVDIHIHIVEVLHTYVMGLTYRLARAARLTNAYCHEGYSRGMWKRRPRQSARPQNMIQELWWSWNESRDAFDADLRAWQHTRSIAGSMSNKAAKALKKSEDQWLKRHEDLTARTIEDAVNWVIRGEREEQKPLTVTVNGETFVVPKVHASQSVDEMQEELMRAVRGEKDYHDLMVDQYKEHHRAKNEAARRERQEALDKARKASEERGISGRTTIVGYTPEQLAEINPEILNQPAARRQQNSPERERFDQYLDTDVGVGWIGTSGRPEKAGVVGPGPNDAPPETESLQDKISRRKPRLKS
jgi:hypothetical protein